MTTLATALKLTSIPKTNVHELNAANGDSLGNMAATRMVNSLYKKYSG